MKQLMVRGIGVVSPAGWGLAPLRNALTRAESIGTQALVCPGRERTLRVRRVPKPEARLSFMGDPRMRRSPSIAQYVVAAALEALGEDQQAVKEGTLRLGIVIVTMCGCVTYSRRFYHECLHEPATASPLLFPETVFNAPGSHLAALLGSTGLNYTLVGDQASLGIALAMGADWLLEGMVDGCLVVGAEELDCVMADAMHYFSHRVVLSEGAGAVYLRVEESGAGGVAIEAIASPRLYLRGVPRDECLRQVREQLPPLVDGDLLCDGCQGALRVDRAEERTWQDWTGPRVSPRRILGEGLAASGGWQVVAAVDALRRGAHGAATVSLAGGNEQATAIRLARHQTAGPHAFMA